MTAGPGGMDPLVGAGASQPVQPTTPTAPASAPQQSTGAAGGSDQRSLGEIFSDVTSDLTTLVKQELELARTELKQEAAKAGKGAGMLGGAGVAGHLALLLASFAFSYLLDNWMPVELAFFITTLLWAIAAGVLAMRGRAELRKTNPELPKTQQTLKEDAAWARAQKS